MMHALLLLLRKHGHLVQNITWQLSSTKLNLCFQIGFFFLPFFAPFSAEMFVFFCKNGKIRPEKGLKNGKKIQKSLFGNIDLT